MCCLSNFEKLSCQIKRRRIRHRRQRQRINFFSVGFGTITVQYFFVTVLSRGSTPKNITWRFWGHCLKIKISTMYSYNQKFSRIDTGWLCLNCSLAPQPSAEGQRIIKPFNSGLTPVLTCHSALPLNRSMSAAWWSKYYTKFQLATLHNFGHAHKSYSCTFLTLSFHGGFKIT